MRMRPAELHALLELKLLPGLGDIRLRRLLRRHATAAEALAAYHRNPREALGLRPARSVANGAGPTAPDSSESGVAREIRAERIERAAGWISRTGVSVIVERQRKYPPRLRHLHDPPPILFALGDLSLLRAPAVAVVGTRQHSEYGRLATETLAGGLARAGVVIVSGMARGIDRIAHEQALQAGSPTVGVLGCGLDVAYPPEHERLQEMVAREGLLLSEFLPGEPPLQHNFPKRNRLIAALALAVIVVEAGVKSGTLITVDHALDLGREVFAVPGPIGRVTSLGTNDLIREGARLVTSAEEVMEVLGLRAVAREHIGWGEGSGSGMGGEREGPADGRSAVELDVLGVLGVDGIHVDDLASRCGVSANDALVTLFRLEVNGFVKRLPGMRFTKSVERV
jgi:DNA processing protein